MFLDGDIRGEVVCLAFGPKTIPTVRNGPAVQEGSHFRLAQYASQRSADTESRTSRRKAEDWLFCLPRVKKLLRIRHTNISFKAFATYTVSNKDIGSV